MVFVEPDRLGWGSGSVNQANERAGAAEPWAAMAAIVCYVGLGHALEHAHRIEAGCFLGSCRYRNRG